MLPKRPTVVSRAVVSRSAALALLSAILALGIAYFVAVRSDSAYAQSTACIDIIPHIEEALYLCDTVNENFACYASFSAEAQPLEYNFFDIADQRYLRDIRNIATLDLEGVVILNLPIEGEASTLRAIIFGPADLENLGDSALRFAVASGDLCDNTPASMMLQVDDSVQATITGNGIGITLASTVFITMDDEGRSIIANVEGQVEIAVGDDRMRIDEGFQVVATMDGIEALQQRSPYVTSEVVQFVAHSDDGLRRVRARACIGDFDPATGQVVGRTLTERHECVYELCIGDRDEFASISLQSMDGSFDPQVSLLAPDGAMLSFNDDNGPATRDSLICNQPVVQGACYQIVVQSYQHRSSGWFYLKVNGETACEEPPDICTVATLSGLNLRQTPSLDGEILGTLAHTDRVIRLGENEEGTWLYVRVQNSGLTAWVLNDPSFIQCEPRQRDPITITTTPTLTPTPTGSPTPSATPTNTPDKSDPPPVPTATLPPPKTSTYLTGP